jgi:dipeptidyl aminopeptidase/acylaminoacyl peptidase
MRRMLTFLIVLSVLALVPIAARQAATSPAAPPAQDATPRKADTAPAPPAAPRPMELADVIAWRNIGAAAFSNDGKWIAYRLSPTEGDSEVFVKATDSDKAYKFPVGEMPSAGGGPGPGEPGEGGPPSSSLSFSPDSTWVAFTVYPSRAESQRLRRQRRPAQAKMQALDLASGKDITIENIRRYSFSGERGGWLAIAKAPATAGGPGGTPAQAAPPGAGSGGGAGAASDRPKGADLILRELATGRDLNIGNVAEFAFDKSGRYLALVIDAPDKAGNGLQLRDMETGVVMVLDSDKASYERLAWTEKGDGLAVLKGTDDKRYTDKLYTAVGFTGFGAGSVPQRVGYDPASDKSFPEGMSISPNRSAAWTEDLSAIVFGIRTLKKSAAKPEPPKPGEEGPDPTAKPEAPAAPPAPDTPEEDKVDLVLWHHKDPRLQSQQQVQEQSDKNFSYLSVYRVKEGKFVRLADDSVRSVNAAPKGRFAIGYDVREYELTSNLDGRRYQDVYVINMQTGERKLALKKARNPGQPSDDGTKFHYFEDGHYFVYDMASGQSANLTKLVPTSFINLEDDHNVAKPPRPALGWTSDSSAILLSDGWDIWKVPVAGSPAVNLTGNGKKDAIRYRTIYRLDPDEKGYDLSAPRYVSSFGEYTKKAGISRLDPGKPGVQPLRWEDATFGLNKARKADVYFYTTSTFKNPPDIFVTDASLKPGKPLASSDDQVKAFTWSSGQMLVEYTFTLNKVKGPQKLQGSLSLPANYEKGKTYPTIVYIYEKLTQGHNAFATPTANGFNKSVYTSNGYAVLQPDITYALNDPGVSAVACITAAVKAAIATGVVDPKRVGLQGHSWGGYQTAFAVTQTDMFAAAVAGAPLTNMVSMYSLIYKNSGGTNQAIFESSQGRFLGSYSDNWEAYVRNSPVNFAKNVKTPLIILHNDKDGAVDFTQGVEYYNTLRRLGKNVIMLEYVGENHGLVKPANRFDYTIRMKEFFDHYLKGAPAPRWITDGVPRLEMEDHLKDRANLKKSAAEREKEKAKEAAAKKPGEKK